jgi:hypothetical protein
MLNDRLSGLPEGCSQPLPARAAERAALRARRGPRVAEIFNEEGGAAPARVPARRDGANNVGRQRRTNGPVAADRAVHTSCERRLVVDVAGAGLGGDGGRRG